MSVLLSYEFATGSLSAIKRSFKTIEGMAEQSARNEEKIKSRVAARARPAAARASLDPQKKAWDDMAKYGETRMRQTVTFRERMEKRGHSDRMRMIATEQRARDAAERARDRVRRATVGRVADSAIRSTVGVGKAILGATGIAGGAIAASRIGPAIDLQHQQRELLRAGRAAGTDYGMSEAELSGRVKGAALATGTSQTDVTAGAHAFVEKTGDLKGAVDNLQTFATVAAATGASVEDIGSAAADLSQKFDIKTTEGMSEALAMLAFQGKKGAFEIKNMAAEFPLLASAAANAGLRGEGGVKNLGGLIQIATVGAGKEQATTALVDAFTELSKHAKELEGGSLGKRINVFEKGKGIGHGEVQRNFGDVIQELVSAAHGDMTKIEPIFGLRGIKAINPLVGAYQKADIAAGGGRAGDMAGRAALVKMIQENVEAGGTFKEVQIDAAHALQDTSAQLENLNTNLTDAVRSKLLPALIELVPKLQPLIPLFGDVLDKLAALIGWASENPWAHIPELISGYVLADLAATGIGSAVKNMIVGLIAEGGAAKAVGGIAGAVTGAAGTAAGGLGLGAAGAGALAVGGAAALAAGGLGAAAYQAYGLYKDVSQTGWGGDAGKASTPEQYDAMIAEMRKNSAALAENTAATRASGSGVSTGPVTSPNRGPDPTGARL
jgi:hypothetical protein